jgi:signal transduction histidine kinase
MRRRILLAILATAISAVVLVGIGTLALTNLGGKRATEAEARSQATALAKAIATLPDGREKATLTLLRSSLKVDGLEVVDIVKGKLVSQLPSGVTLSPEQINELVAGHTISGTSNRLSFAASPVIRPLTTAVVVITRRVQGGVGPAFRWLVLSSVLVIIIAVALSWFVSRRVARPIAQAAQVTTSIADGDLDARLEPPPAHHDDELATLARSVNSMAESLQRSRVLEQQFLMSVSHDLRTPLTSIRGYAEAIADGAATDPAAAARVIMTSAARLDRLVKDLLELAKLESKRFSMTPAPTHLAFIAQTAVEGLTRPAADAGVALACHPQANPIVTADPDRLAQCLANLIENAVKFAKANVVVAVWEHPSSASITVDDDGPGIASADLPHVFERLYVAKREPTRQESGSGLGLAIVKELTEAMG